MVSTNDAPSNLKFPNGIFQLHLPGITPIIIGREYLKEYYFAPDDELSFRQSLAEALQLEYTFGKDIAVRHYHVELARTAFTRRLQELFPAIVEEVDAAISDEIPISESSVL